MSDTQQPKRVILVPRGLLSGTATRGLRKNGYSVIHASDPSQIKFLGEEKFNAASDRAKIKAFDFAMENKYTCILSLERLREWYIFYLKQNKDY